MPTVGGLPRLGLAHVLADGTVDPAWTPGLTAAAISQGLLGADKIGSYADSNDGGVAEAFRATADLSGTARHLRVRLSTVQAPPEQLVLGVYANDRAHPGKLLASGSIASPSKGWAEVTVPAVALKTGTRYWLAVLSPRGAGAVAFQDGPE